MKKMKLLAPKWKWIGLALAIPGLVLGALAVFGNFEIPGLEIQVRETAGLFKPKFENFTDELSLTLVVVGFLFMCYSRERDEDERIQLIRLEAFQWSILFNFAILLIGNWSMYNGNFFYLMTFNLFTPLVVFLLRFYYVLYIVEARAAINTEDAL